MLKVFSGDLRCNTIREILQRDYLISHSQGYSLYSTYHRWRSWYFFKCSFGHAASNFKPSKHLTLFVRFTFNQVIFYDPTLNFCNTTSAGFEKVLPRPAWAGAGCFCSPLSFSFTAECCFEVVLMRIEQLSSPLHLIFSVILLLLFPACLPDLVLADTSKCEVVK